MKFHYPNQVILSVKLSVVFLFFSLHAVFGASEVVFGERPEIKLELVDDAAFYHTHVWIKFEDHITRHLDENDVTFDKDGFVSFGISAVDDLNRAFGVRSFRHLYDSGALDRSYRDRHRRWGFHLWYELLVDEDQDIRAIVKAFEEVDAVAHAAPEFRKILHLPSEGDSNLGFRDQWFPDDPLFNQQWHYHNTGQAEGTPGADISLPAAWQIETGNPEVIVAVVDGGIQADHPDLAANMWEGIGYNFADNTYDILPTDHGTHVAGTVAAVNNNNKGIAGVAGGSGFGDGVRLMSAQIYSDGSSGGNHLAQIYAADHGAAISQNSWGYTDPDVFNQLVLDAIDYFNAHGGGTALQGGGITIFAAGNSNSEEAYYPAFYAGTLSVAATNNSDVKASYSNYGDWIDVSAPGGETSTTQAAGVLSTLIGSTYGFLSGTSMACPHVSGVAALIISMAYGELTAEDVTEIILTTADSICESNPDYIGKLGSGRLNAYAALLATQNFEPVESEFAGGSGTVDDPYIIATPQHLNNVRNYPNNQAVHFALKNDIDLAEACGPGGDFYYNGQGWEPIGYILNYDEKQEPQGFFFSGTFDGRGYEISGLYINRPLSDNIGLFGYTNVATVKNLGVVNAQVTGRDFVGALMGVNYCHSVIEKCYSSGVLQGRDNVGGLVGSNMIADLLNSHSSVTVQASGSGAGGIVGMNAGSSVQNSYSTGNVSADSDAGGLAGYNYDSTIQNCFSSSYVLAGEFSGGLIASNFLSNVSNCYSIGQVDVLGDDAGGLIAESFWSSVTNSYWNTQTSGQNSSSGGEGRTTLQMTYPYAGNTFSGWDFQGIWAADTDYQENNGYPYLRKELFMPPTHFAGGSGTKTDPFQIANAQQLDNIRYYLGPLFAKRYYIQVADIDLDVSPWNHGEGWQPIGEPTWDDQDDKVFYGSFDGNGFLINGLYIDRPEDNDQGLFGYIFQASLKNIILQNVNITANNSVGGLVGKSIRSVISNVSVSGYINGNNDVGGLAGEALRGQISFSGSNAAVSGNDRIGGLVGRISRAYIQKSYSQGEVNGEFLLGGLIGSGFLSEIHACYSNASTNGVGSIGGLVGSMQNGLISHSYSIGIVTGESNVGGFVGFALNQEDISNYWDVSASQIGESAMGEGRTTQEMTHPHASNTYESWLFGLTWKEDADYEVNNGYPFLKDFSEPPRKLTAIGGAGNVQLSWSPPLIPNTKSKLHGEGIYDAANERLQEFLERHHMLSGNHQNIINRKNPKSIVGYNVYRDNEKINTSLIAGEFYIDTEVEPEVMYEYFVTAVYSDYESVPSQPDKVMVFVGSGTAADPWQISTAVHLYQVRKYGGADHHDKHFIQTADIDLDVAPWNEDEGWSPIGSKGNKGFFGNYDGQGYYVRGLFISRQDIQYQGLFSKLNGAVIKNLGLEVRRVRGSRHVGGLAGSSYNAWIENCFVAGKNMFVYDVIGTRNVGGLVGMVDSSSQLLSSFSNIRVAGGENIGGLVGLHSNSSLIKNCYSKGRVKNSVRTGAGLVGRVENAEIRHSYSMANVSGGEDNGGLTGYSINSEVVNSYWDTETSGFEDSSGGEGRTTMEMTYPYAENTFVNWDFEHVWVADEDHTQNSGYPILVWQPYVEPDVPVERLVHDISLDPGDGPYCFDATETITVLDFVVEPGAEVIMIAGQKIVFLEGTHIHEGAYMHAYIAADGPFCMDREKHFLATEDEMETADQKEIGLIKAYPHDENDIKTHTAVDISETKDANTDLFNIYPNPATDKITIWINLAETDVLSMEINIYSIHGEHLVNRKATGPKNNIGLETLKPGLYIVQVSNKNNAYISRLIIL